MTFGARDFNAELRMGAWQTADDRSLFLDYLDELEQREAKETGRWASPSRARLGPEIVFCLRCGQSGNDAFGPQLEGGWHEGCAADVAHEGKRDHDPHYHQ